MLLSSRAAGCVLITAFLLMAVPLLASRGNGNMKASVQQVFDGRPFSAVYSEKHPSAASKTHDGYFLGPYQPLEEHHAPEYAQEPSYKARQYPDAPQGPTDKRQGYDRPDQPQYQPDHERYSAYDRNEREIRDPYELEGTREAYKPQQRPEPEPYQQYEGEYKGSSSREGYRGRSDMHSDEPYTQKRGYGYDDKDEQYKEQDSGEQYSQPRSYVQYKEREYKDIVPICLQRTSSKTSGTAPAIWE
jgi:hypothetical protein